LGLVDQEKLFELTDAIGDKDTSKGISLLDQLIDSGMDLPEFVNSLLQHLRDLLMVKVAGDSNVLFDLSDTYLKKYKEKSATFSETDLLRMIKVMADLNSNLKRASDPRVMLEMSLMKILRMESSVDLTDLLEKLELLKGCSSVQMERNSSIPPSNIPQKKPSSIPPEKSTEKVNREDSLEEKIAPVEQEPYITTKLLSLDDIQQRWSEVLGEVKSNKLSLWSLIKDGEVVGLEDDTLTIEFHNGNSFHKKQAERRENLNLMQKALGDVFAQPFKLKFELNELKDANSDKPNDAKSKNGSSPPIANDPLMKSIFDNFEGEIIR
jgi:DNA polymerase-3 subunit gamma/tau